MLKYLLNNNNNIVQLSKKYYSHFATTHKNLQGFKRNKSWHDTIKVRSYKVLMKNT